MSRIEKGGAKFKPVARPVARPRPALPPSQPAASQPAAAGSSQAGSGAPPPSSQPAPTSESAFSKPPALYGARDPAPPSSASASTSAPSAAAASASSSSKNPSNPSEHAIPIPPARQYNPYLHDAAPPPIIVREPTKSSTKGEPPPVRSARQEGGRAAPTIASTAATSGSSSSDRRSGSAVPTIATTTGPLPPMPVNRARAAPSIASTSGPVASSSSSSSSSSATPAVFKPAPRVGAAARAPSIAATTSTSSSSMAPPPSRPIASSSSNSRATTNNGRAPSLATTPASPPPPSQPSAPIAATRGDSPIVPSIRPIIATPVSSARGDPSSPPPPSQPTQPGASSLPLGSRPIPRGLPPPVPEAGPSKGKKRAAAAAAATTTTASPAKKAKGRSKKKTAEEAEAEEDAAEVDAGVGAAVGEGGSNENANGDGEAADDVVAGEVEGSSSAVAPSGPKGKKPYVRTRPTPKIVVKRKARMVVDSDEDELDTEGGEAGASKKKKNADGTYGGAADDGDESPDETIQLQPKRKYVKKAVDPNAPPKAPRKKVERDADGNAISKYTRAPPKPRAPKEILLGPDGEPLPPPKRKRKPRPPTGNPIGRPRKPVETIADIPDVEAHNLLAGDGPDVLTTTMKEICEDTGMGRISSRFVEIQRKALDLKEARRAARDRMKARLRKAKDPGANDSEDEEGPLTILEGGNAPEGAYVRPQHAAGSAAALDALALAAKEAKRAANEAAGVENPLEDEDDENDIDGVAEGGYAPQFRLVNGEMVLDQESLVADRHAETEARGEEEMDVVEERDTDRFVNSTTWGKKLRGERWSKEETDLFFTAINQFGTDFEMIARLFPGRTRKMIKNKWNREESSNSTRVTEALLMKVPVDVATYSRMTQTDLSGPPPEIIAPPPPPPTTPRNASAGPSKPKKKRNNLRDGEEIVGQTGADGEEIRFDASDEDEVADLVARSRGRAGSTTSSVGAKSNASNGGGGGGGERPRSTSAAAVGAGAAGRKPPSVGASGPAPAPAAAAEKGKEKEKASGGLPGEMSDDEDLPGVGAIGR